MKKPPLHPLTAVSLLVLLFVLEIGLYDLITRVPNSAFAEWAIEWFRDLFNGEFTFHLFQGILTTLILTAINSIFLRLFFSIGKDSLSLGQPVTFGGSMPDKGSIAWTTIQLSIIFLGVIVVFYILFLAFGGWLFSGDWDMQFGALGYLSEHFTSERIARCISYQ